MACLHLLVTLHLFTSTVYLIRTSPSRRSRFFYDHTAAAAPGAHRFGMGRSRSGGEGGRVAEHGEPVRERRRRQGRHAWAFAGRFGGSGGGFCAWRRDSRARRPVARDKEAERWGKPRLGS